MDLYEYQAKHLFDSHGVPVTAGEVCATPEAAHEAARKIGSAVVVKAQVKTGGRGKAGGVKLAATPDEAQARADDILGLDIKGHVVRRVLVTEATDIAEEYYVSFLLDRANRAFLAMASVEGGVDIEEVAATRPDALALVRIDAIVGVDKAAAARIVEQAGFPAHIRDQVTAILVDLWQVMVKEDATLVEVNPLVLSADGRVLALDGKVTLDDNAHYRHASHADLVDKDDTDPIELRAKEFDLNYVKLDGEVGIIGNGAGLVMSTLDVVAYAGEELGGVRPANFLDIGGGASAEVMSNGLTSCSTTPMSVLSSSTSSAASPRATRSPTESCRRSARSPSGGLPSPSPSCAASMATMPWRADASSRSSTTLSSRWWRPWMTRHVASPSSPEVPHDDLARCR